MRTHHPRFHSPRLPALTAIASAALLVVACGGGGGDDTTTPAGDPASLVGTAATGAALAKAGVTIRDKDGPVCAEQTIFTTDTGAYSCTLQAGKSAPFSIVVTDPSGALPPMVSIATETPQPGASLVANVTPLTTAIVAQLSPTRDALAVAAAPGAVDAAALKALTAKVVAQVADVLTAIGAPAGYNPFSTPITAATGDVSGNTADQVIEVLKISTVNGETRIATVDQPEKAVAIAGTGSATAAKVTAPAEEVVSLSDALKWISAAFDACFQVDVPKRVLAVDNTVSANDGGPRITQMDPACQGIVHTDFYSSGRDGGQYLHGLLTNPDMTGAKFSLPELMIFLPAGSGGGIPDPRAVINLRYVDGKGNGGNLIAVARRYSGTDTGGRASDWWLYGNQHPIEANITSLTRRNVQRAPAGTAPFLNVGNSRFEAGLNVFINMEGPHSAGMRAVRVTGPGTPTQGLVYTRHDPALLLAQNWLSLRRKDGNTDPAAATFASSPNNLFYMQRTMGVSGADATTVRANPNAGNTNNTQYMNWAHPVDYGRAPGSTDYIDFGTLGANGAYRFEVFYNGELTPRYNFTTLRLHPVVPATQSGNQQWVDLTPETLRYLDPTDALAASTSSLSIAWTPNPYAELIRSAGVYTTANGVPVHQPTVNVPLGSTSATAVAPQDSNGVTVPFQPLTNDGSTYREIQLRYRTTDGSYKDSITRFN